MLRLPVLAQGAARMARGWWLFAAPADGRMECHTRKQADEKAHQCAGAAIYRSNVCKFVSAPLLKLQRDKEKVFSWDDEFATHHARRPVSKDEAGNMKASAMMEMLNREEELTGIAEHQEKGFLKP